MIRNDEQLGRTREGVASLERSLAILQRDRPHLHPDRFALMAAPILEDLHRLRLEIDDYLGVTEALRLTIPLWLVLRGPQIDLANAPTSVITAMIDTLRIGIQAVAEYLFAGTIGSRPTALLKRACELRLAAWQPGSVQVGLELASVVGDTGEATDLAPRVREALQIYLIGAAWVGSGEGFGQLEHLLPDPEQRRIVLNQVARLIPRPRGELNEVELSGRAVPQRAIRLDRESRTRVREAIKRLADTEEELIRVEGFLREIDLDERTFILREPEQAEEMRCFIAADAIGLMEIAKAALDHRVGIVGTRRRDPTRRQTFPLEVSEIEIMGGDDEPD